MRSRGAHAQGQDHRQHVQRALDAHPLSFEIAEKRLSAESLNFGGSSTSSVKGESLVDTVETLNAYKIDCIVVRDKHAGAALHRHVNSPASVICAGDGKHNHPTQALLDLYTIWETQG